LKNITVTRIAEVRDLYANTDLRTKLARHHGPNVDTLFRDWTDVWLRPTSAAGTLRNTSGTSVSGARHPGH
jgi:hypothetical protein